MKATRGAAQYTAPTPEKPPLSSQHTSVCTLPQHRGHSHLSLTWAAGRQAVHLSHGAGTPSSAAIAMLGRPSLPVLPARALDVVLVTWQQPAAQPA
jgi:hypothetical protein